MSEGNDDVDALPPGWAKVRLGDAGEWFGGGTPSKKNPEYWDDGDIPWLSPKDMKGERLRGTQDHVTGSAVAETAVRLVPHNSVALVVRSGVLEHSVPVSSVPFATTLNQDMKAIVPHEGVSPDWLAWSLRRHERVILDSCRKAGTTVASLSTKALANLEIPLPPLAEQHRIVEALEEQLSRLDAASASLTLAERRAAQFRQAAIEVDLSEGPDLQFVALKDVLREPLRNGHSAKASTDQTGVRTLNLTAVTSGSFTDANTKMTVADPVRVRGLWLEAGDILVQRSNTPDLVGTSALYRGESDWAIFPDLLVRVRVSDTVVPEYALLHMQSRRGRSYFKRKAKGLAGSMPKIDQAAIESFTFPLPDVESQRKIVEHAQREHERIKLLNDEISRSRKRAQTLRNALLRKAFNGTLVPQDPDDEPASILLDRIAAERAASTSAKKTRQPRKRAAVPKPASADAKPAPDPTPAPRTSTQPELF